MACWEGWKFVYLSSADSEFWKVITFVPELKAGVLHSREVMLQCTFPTWPKVWVQEDHFHGRCVWRINLVFESHL